MTEEEEWGQLGVLSYQQDGRTEFGRRAEMRHTAQKAMVNIDTGRRYAAALLRHSRNVEKNNTVGDLIMYKTKRSDVVNEEKEQHASFRLERSCSHYGIRQGCSMVATCGRPRCERSPSTKTSHGKRMSRRTSFEQELDTIGSDSDGQRRRSAIIY